MNSPVTVVLPVHNAERTLRPAVMRMLELSETLGHRMRVAVVDDGSTDGTYEAACELARRYPQLHVMREPFQRGLGGALEQVRNRLGVDQVVVHDGVTPVDAAELSDLLSAASATATPYAGEGRGSRRHAAAGTLTARSLEAHRRGGSFRWLRLDEPLSSRRKTLSADGRKAPSPGGEPR